MSAQPDRADHEVLGNDAPGLENPLADSDWTPEPEDSVIETDWSIEGIDLELTPLQYHYLSFLQRLIALKNSYQTDPSYESALMGALNKAIYSTLRDSIEANVGDEAKELLNREHQVN